MSDQVRSLKCSGCGLRFTKRDLTGIHYWFSKRLSFSVSGRFLKNATKKTRTILVGLCKSLSSVSHRIRLNRQSKTNNVCFGSHTFDRRFQLHSLVLFHKRFQLYLCKIRYLGPSRWMRGIIGCWVSNKTFEDRWKVTKVHHSICLDKYRCHSLSSFSFYAPLNAF